MSTTTDMAERHGRILGELAEFGHDLAKKLHRQAMAAETPAETAELARAFHGVARSVRQTLALEAKLARDAARQDREDQVVAERQAREAQQAARAAIDARRRRIGAAIEPIVYAEVEDEDEAEQLFDEVFERIDDEARAGDFLEQAVDEQIAHLCQDFGLPRPGEPREERPDPDPDPGLGPGRVPYALEDWADADEPPRAPLNGAGQSP